MKFLIFLCLAGIALATPLDKIQGARIAGGEQVAPGEVKFMVQVEGPLGLGGLRCGGAIYNETTVLTESSCANAGLVTLLNTRIRVGSLKRNQGGQVIRVTKQTPVGQLTILTLASNINMGYQTGPIELYYGDIQNKQVTVAGWGPSSQSNPALAYNLQKITVPVRTIAECRQYFPFEDYNILFCAGHGHGGCGKDIGGPAWITENGVEKLVGIVAIDNPCDVNDEPGRYHKVSLLSNIIPANL